MGLRKPTIFISYSHKDERWKDRLLVHLGVLEKEGRIEVWSDNMITAGGDWFTSIKNAIGNSELAVLLITAHFLTSDFILREEVPRLLEARRKRGMQVFPVLVKSCLWEEVPWLASLQMRPLGGKPLAKFLGNRLDEQLALITREVLSKLRRRPGDSVEVPELVSYLQKTLGFRTTAYLSGLDDVGLVHLWGEGRAFPEELAMRRLVSAYEATLCLVNAYDAQTARSWFLGMNPGFDDEAPARVLRRAEGSKVCEDVVLAAIEFAET